MKKIIFYSRAFYTGGMENAAFNLIKMLKETGEYEITVCYKISDEMTEKMLLKLATVAKIACVVGNEFECDVLINCDRKDFPLTFIKSKKVIHWFSSNLIENVDKIQGKVVAQSRWHYDNLERLGIKNISIIGNPLDVNTIVNKSKEEITDCNFPGKKIYLVVSRISHEKGFDRIINFIANRLRTEKNAILVIVGGVTAPKNEEIKMKLIRYLRNYVVFLGEKDNPYPYFLKSDYVLCLSDNEIYGLVSEEAHILGKQVIFNRYATAKDQFIENYDMWYDKDIVKQDEKLDDFWLSAIYNNKQRFEKWKELIDDEEN